MQAGRPLSNIEPIGGLVRVTRFGMSSTYVRTVIAVLAVTAVGTVVAIGAALAVGALWGSGHFKSASEQEESRKQ